MIFFQIERVNDQGELQVAIAEAFKLLCVKLDTNDVLVQDADVGDLLRCY